MGYPWRQETSYKNLTCLCGIMLETAVFEGYFMNIVVCKAILECAHFKSTSYT